ncbi:vWA domain-containing protein [Planctomycetaceae bacterium SH139]
MSGWSFTYPFVLLLLLIPAALIAHLWRRQGREVAIPLDHGDQPSGDGWRRVIGWFEMLPGLVLAVVIVLLAGPQEVGQPRTKRALTNIEFCVDISGSMTASFGEQTRYEASMQAISDFVNDRQGDAFGLTFFSDIALQWVPLTTDTSAFEYALPFMDPRRPLPAGLGGGTQIGRALEDCRQTLIEREQGDRMIVLVSDGASADLSSGRDAEIAAQLKADGIVLYDIHVADGDVPDQIVNLAYLTDGEVFQPGDTEALAGVFKRIDGMQKTRLEKVAAESHDFFLPPAIAGLSLLGLAVVSLFGLRYTPW